MMFEGWIEPWTSTLAVDEGQGLGQHPAHVVHLLEAHLVAGVQGLGEVAARHELGHHAALPRHVHEAEDLDHAGMGEGGRGLQVGDERLQDSRARRRAPGAGTAGPRCGRPPGPRRDSTTPSGPRPISSWLTKRGALAAGGGGGAGGGPVAARAGGGAGDGPRRGAQSRGRRRLQAAGALVHVAELEVLATGSSCRAARASAPLPEAS